MISAPLSPNLKLNFLTHFNWKLNYGAKSYSKHFNASIAVNKLKKAVGIVVIVEKN